jgi:hypothetical protein
VSGVRFGGSLPCVAGCRGFALRLAGMAGSADRLQIRRVQRGAAGCDVDDVVNLGGCHCAVRAADLALVAVAG